MVLNWNLAEIRHELHRLAEPSGEELRTRQFLLRHIRECYPTDIHLFRNNRNFLVVFDSGRPGPTLLCRADFDAVRVSETIDVPYASCTAGISHKCGHDGHATILLGVAQQLHQNPPQKGRVLLFFQGAEETGKGASQLIDSQILEKYHPDKVFALHNIPGQPLGTVLCRTGSFTCSVVSCDIPLHGRTSHAAEPLKALSPYPAAKNIADRLQQLNRYDISGDDFQLATLVEFHVGECAYGVTAGHGVLHFTLRARTDERLRQLRSRLEQIVEDETQHFGLEKSEIVWKEYFAASKNHPDAVAQVKAAASTCGLPYRELETPFSWGEDFGLLTQHYEGALFGLGSGTDQPALHHQNFDFPDELLPIGVRVFEQLIG